MAKETENKFSKMVDVIIESAPLENAKITAKNFLYLACTAALASAEGTKFLLRVTDSFNIIEKMLIKQALSDIIFQKTGKTPEENLEKQAPDC